MNNLDRGSIPGLAETAGRWSLLAVDPQAGGPASLPEGGQTGNLIESPGILLYNVNYRIYGLLWQENKVTHKAARSPDINRIQNILPEVIYFCIIKK